jgi:hypothetical protein
MVVAMRYMFLLHPTLLLQRQYPDGLFWPLAPLEEHLSGGAVKNIPLLASVSPHLLVHRLTCAKTPGRYAIRSCDRIFRVISLSGEDVEDLLQCSSFER